MGAAYLVGFTRNHGFVEGNKRIGLATMLAFLGVDGWRIVAPGDELLALVLGVATSEIDERTAAAWLRAHARTRTRP